MLKITDNVQVSRVHFTILKPGDVFRYGNICMKIPEVRDTCVMNAIDLHNFNLIYVPPITEVIPLYNAELVINPDNEEEED